MITRIEIDGFKSFEGFSLDLQPFTAIVGPNASGKSNLFDALRFLSLLARENIHTAMQGRGRPEEFFRKTETGICENMTFAVEVLLEPTGVDAFGTKYDITARRVRYELTIGLARNTDGMATGVFLRNENCRPLKKSEETATYLAKAKIDYSRRKSAFIDVDKDSNAIEIRQDGPNRHGRARTLPLLQAPRTALSTVATAEFPHLYALQERLSDIRFLEINPSAARSANDQLVDPVLKPDASNLAAVLAHLRDETKTDLRPDGVLSDIAADLSSLIPSVHRLNVQTDINAREYSFGVEFHGGLVFSSRVISDGTLRLLALLAALNDPKRRGTLCFEEPENGVHEGRVSLLIDFLRDAAHISAETADPSLQIIINTHSPRVMRELRANEIVAADTMISINGEAGTRSVKTRMRPNVSVKGQGVLFNPELHLHITEVERLLQHPADAA